MSRTLFLAALFLAQAAGAAPQDEMLYYRDGVRIDPAEVSRILGGPVMKTRSIRLLPESPRDEPSPTVSLSTAAHQKNGGLGGGGASSARSVASTSPVAAAPVEPALEPVTSGRRQPDSIALPVQFAFASADILPGARTQLDAVAEGIKLLPAGNRVLIEGHTDALGSDQYNLQLSRKRAEAVKQYLVTEHGLDAQRLKTVGYGEDRPIDGVDASKPENRRVQFRGA